MNMNAKDILRGRTDEASKMERPGHRSARMGGPRPGAGPADPHGGDINRAVGREPEQFSRDEVSQLKDVLIQILATLAASNLDKEIGQALMAGQPLQPGQLQHILDEARRIELPPSHDQLLQKIFQQISQQPR